MPSSYHVGVSLAAIGILAYQRYTFLSAPVHGIYVNLGSVVNSGVRSPATDGLHVQLGHPSAHGNRMSLIYFYYIY